LFLAWDLLDSNFNAANRLASKAANLAGYELYNAVFFSVNSEVAANHGAFASALGSANLANDNLTAANFLATVNLNTKSLTWTVFNILGCTTGFNV
jgi:hypothetical protein